VKKRKNTGKAKGSKFEREVSKMCDTWWCVAHKTFWRTEGSGAMEQPGDIAPRLLPRQTPPWFPFLIECKSYKEVSFFSLYNKETKTGPKILKWWRQVEEAQGRAVLELNFPINDALKLLVFKQNYGRVLCAFDPIEFYFFNDDIIEKARKDGVYMSVSFPEFDHDVIIMEFEAFRNLYNKDICEELFKEVE